MISGCRNYGYLSASDNSAGSMAGIVGYARDNCQIVNCENYGNINFPDEDQPDDMNTMGGIAGWMDDNASMTGCVNHGSINAKSAGYTGGVVGCMDGKNVVTNCENRGEIKSQHRVGGIVGQIGAEFSVDCYITDCVNYGKVTGSGDCVGGVAGFNNCGAKNLINHGDVTGDKSVGGVIGENSSFGNAQNMYNYGDVAGNEFVGGVGGQTTADQVNFKINIGLDHSFGVAGNYGDVTGGPDSTRIGGVLGYATNHSISKVFNEGNVTGGISVGGVIGDAHTGVADCYNTGDVYGESGVGGLAGDTTGTRATYNLSNSYNAGHVDGGKNVGALVGTRVNSSSTSYMHNLYYNTDITGSLEPYGNHKVSDYDWDIVGMATEGMVGEGLRDDFENDWESWSFNTAAEPTQEDRTYKLHYPILTEFEQLEEPFDVPFPGVLMHDFESQALDGASQPRYEGFTYIKTAADLAAAEHDGRYVLANDIDMLGAALPMLDDGKAVGFKGKLDGVGHTIKGFKSTNGLTRKLEYGSLMYLTLEGEITYQESRDNELGAFAHEMGLFSTIYKCTNKAVIDASGAARDDAFAVGGLVGRIGDIGETGGLNARILSCENAAGVTGAANHTGGMVGSIGAEDGATVQDCVNQGAISGESYVGGMVGYSVIENPGYLTGCANHGDIQATGSVAGGIAGQAQSISDCANKGAISAENGVLGGIAGQVQSVSDCENEGVISSAYGILGGIAGQAEIDVTDCVNRGTVASTTARYVGGIVGIAYGTVSFCQNFGGVTGASDTGGLIGCMEKRDSNRDSRLSDSCNTAAVTGTGNRTGGLVGCAVNPWGPFTEIKSCYNTGDVTGKSRTGGLLGGPDLYGATSQTMYTVGFDSCFNTGSVSGETATGGLLGEGVKSVLLSSSNLGAVTGSGTETGGLIGRTTGNPAEPDKKRYYYCELYDCSSIGDVNYAGAESEPFVGGLIGRAGEEIKIDRCFFSGTIGGSGPLNGAVAAVATVDPEISLIDVRNVYYNTDHCKHSALVYTDGSALEDADRFDTLHNISGLKTENMTGGDVLTAEGKMTALTPSGWTAKETETTDDVNGVYLNAYYPQPSALEQLGAPWTMEQLVQAYDHELTGIQTPYQGKPVPFEGKLFPGAEQDVPYSVLYVGKGDTVYPLTAQAPTNAGHYFALITALDPLVSPRFYYAHIVINTKNITITANDAERLIGEQNPEFTFTAEGLCAGDTVSDLDNIVWECEATPESPVGEYPITIVTKKDDNYAITTANPGKLTVTQDDPRDHYKLSGQTGVDGFSDWHIGPVTITGTDGYDLISKGMVNQEVTWSDSLTLDYNQDFENDEETIMLKKSSTGAYTEKETITLNYGAPLRQEDHGNSPAPGSTIKPEASLIKFQYSPGIAFRESGEYRVYADGELLYTFTADDVATGRVTIDNNHSTHGIKEGEIELHIGEALPPNATISLVAVSTKDEWGPLRSVVAGAPCEQCNDGDFVYYTKGYTANIDLQNQTETYNAAPQKVVPSITTNADNVPVPPCTVTYEGTGGTVYAQSKTPPTNAGTYLVTAKVEHEDFEPASATCTLTIEKKAVTVKANGAARLVGEQNPTFTFTATGLCGADLASGLDKVVWQCAATRESAAGEYDITLKEAEDDNYEITGADPPGKLTVTQDDAADRVTVRGEKGKNGQSGWYVGEVTLAPDGREGYDLISDDGGRMWKQALSYTSDDTPQTMNLSVSLKKSSTGAITSRTGISFDIYTKELTAEAFSPQSGELYHDPAENVISLTLNQPVEKGRGYFTVTDADGNEFARLNVNALRVHISSDAKTVTLRLPDPFEPYGTYTVTCGDGTLYSQTYGKPFSGLAQGDWTFGVSGSSDTVKISDLMLDVLGESAERRAIYVGKEEADYAAALVPLENGTSTLSITPKVSGVLADDRIKLELLGAVMMNGSQAPQDAVKITGKRLTLADGVKSARIKVTAFGQTASDSVTILLSSTGWAKAVVDNQTGLSISTSNLLEAINPYDVPMLGENQIAVATLTIKEIADGGIDADELALLREGAGESLLGKAYSIELAVDIFEKNDLSTIIHREIISMTQQPIVFSVLFEDDGTDHANERMLRVHEGAVDELRVALLADGTRVFASDLFSTYAPAYDILRNITVEPPEHGTLTADKAQAVKGESVTLTAVPDEGFALSELRVNGQAIGGNTFTMPDMDVRVSAVFAPLPPDSPNGESGSAGTNSGNTSGNSSGTEKKGGAAPTGDTATPVWVWIAVALAAGVLVFFAVKRMRK